MTADIISFGAREVSLQEDDFASLTSVKLLWKHKVGEFEVQSANSTFVKQNSQETEQREKRSRSRKNNLS